MENFVSKEYELIIGEEEKETKSFLEKEKNRRLLELEQISDTYNKASNFMKTGKSYKDLFFKKNFVII